jgi:hypothetical protein
VGHRIVATVAEHQLTPRARAEVDRLLALEPGATLASVSTWADEHRTRQTVRWHFVNFPREARCRYDAARDCRGGRCVVAAIERERKALLSSAPDDERLEALKYLVHFVADVHQPLHAGYADDRGGNRVQLQAYGKGAKLHALWDTGLIEHWPGGPVSLLNQLEASPRPAQEAGLPQQWAEESCRVVATPWLLSHRAHAWVGLPAAMGLRIEGQAGTGRMEVVVNAQ